MQSSFLIDSHLDAWSRDVRFGRVVYHDPRGTRRRLGTRRESENPYIEPTRKVHGIKKLI